MMKFRKNTQSSKNVSGVRGTDSPLPQRAKRSAAAYDAKFRAGSFWKVVRRVFKKILFLPFTLLAWPFLAINRLRRQGRERLILVVILLLTIFSALFDYPDLWNRMADWVNPRIDRGAKRLVKMTGKEWLGQLEKLGVTHFPTIPFLLGLDLEGGTQLVYEADLSRVEGGSERESLEGLRNILERRVNFLGVREPVVQIQESPGRYRILVELAGIQDVNAAVKAVGETPFLEFREERSEAELQGLTLGPEAGVLTPELQSQLMQAPAIRFRPADPPLTGQHLQRAAVVADPVTNQPQVSLQFNDEGAKIFSELTRKNIQRQIAIFVNDILLSAPVVQQEIPSGQAVITGSFTWDEAKGLSRDLNAGALSAPISLLSQQTVGPTLGQRSLERILLAGMVGFAIVSLFMVVWYRLPGVIAVVALGIYTVLLLAMFKIIPVTMTLPGIAGFILSIGMAVDANILIFARMREERLVGKSFVASVEEGFSRAWTSIRDSNISTLITTLILFTFGTSFVKGFALTLGLGVLVSMFSAIFVSRLLLKLFVGSRLERLKFLW